MKKNSLLKIAILLFLQIFAIPLLVAQPIGYASLNTLGQNGTTGGAGGPVVTVTNAADLLDYIARSGPYVIQISGMISLPDGMYDITSDKTVIGLGSNSGITGGGFNVGLPIDNGPTSPPDNAVHNVIIRNLTFQDANDDNLNVMMFSHHVWIDHNTFLSTYDGACDVKRGSNYVTISYNHFKNINKTCLLGHDDGNSAQDRGRLKVTYHHNFFDNCNQRQPRVRFGEPHIFNNYWLNPGSYCIGRGVEASVYSENNHKDGGKDFSKDYGGGSVKDVGSIGGFSTGTVNWNPAERYSYTADPASSVKSIVMANAGVGKIDPTQPTTPPQNTPTPTPVQSGLLGDVNNDDIINIVDALMVAQYYVGLAPPGFVAANADVDCSGTINIIDALQIAQYYVKLISSFSGC
jgi:pectate lyase